MPHKAGQRSGGVACTGNETARANEPRPPEVRPTRLAFCLAGPRMPRLPVTDGTWQGHGFLGNLVGSPPNAVLSGTYADGAISPCGRQSYGHLGVRMVFLPRLVLK